MSQTFRAEVGRTGIRIYIGARQIGGWNAERHHLYVLDSYATTVADHERILYRQGFQRMEQPEGHFWWRISDRFWNRYVAVIEEILGG